MSARLRIIKCNNLPQLLLNVCEEALVFQGQPLNQQLMLDNRFTRISQYFSESDGVEYYRACTVTGSQRLFELLCLQR